MPRGNDVCQGNDALFHGYVALADADKTGQDDFQEGLAIIAPLPSAAVNRTNGAEEKDFVAGNRSIKAIDCRRYQSAIKRLSSVQNEARGCIVDATNRRGSYHTMDKTSRTDVI